MKTTKSKGNAEGVIEAYKFNQEERHVAFWGYIRDNEWDIVEGFIDKKVFILRLSNIDIVNISLSGSAVRS